MPNDYVNTVNCVNEGRPIFQIAPRSPLDQAFKDLAHKVAPTSGAALEAPTEESRRTRRGNFADRVRGIFGKK